MRNFKEWKRQMKRERKYLRKKVRNQEGIWNDDTRKEYGEGKKRGRRKAERKEG
jgi:hypothetical protein